MKRALPAAPDASAGLARCRYVDDARPGIRRARAGRGFRYLSPSGKSVRDAATLRRIESLVITLIRVGNEEYARGNGSFGLTTLRTHHVDVAGSSVRIQYEGRSGKRHVVSVNDRRLAKLIARFHDLPGEELLQYVGDDGELHDPFAADVNEYLRRISGEDVMAKDFRTSLDAWAERIRRYRRGGRDVYVYFDNDVKVRAPFDAMSLAARFGEGRRVAFPRKAHREAETRRGVEEPRPIGEHPRWRRRTA